MVMGGDSCSRGSGFVSHHQILDGHISYCIVVKKYNNVCEDQK